MTEVVERNPVRPAAVAILTGGGDRPYAYGLATALMSKGAELDLIANDELDCPEFHGKAGVRFLNLRGEQSPDASLSRKMWRVLVYYARLIRYAAGARPRIFHILWNNKFQWLDRTLLMVYYRLLGKKIVLTAHNVNAATRDGNDTFWNRLTLRTQYRLADHVFAHTEKMKRELTGALAVPADRITVIPFGINNSVPNTSLTPGAARRRLGIGDGEKTILFFGNIAPYKGVEYLVEAFRQVSARSDDYRLIIAGRPKGPEQYWKGILEETREFVHSGRILLRSDYVPDGETEVYFKAADVFALPYRHIYQSGVLFLGHAFGLPALAADVGPLRDEIVEGRTGFVFRPEDPADLARTIERYFASELYANLDSRRHEIRDHANETHSWDTVAAITMNVYRDLLRPGSGQAAREQDGSYSPKAPF